MMNKFEAIYKKLEELGVIDLIEQGKDSAKSVSSGFMDFNLDILYREDESVMIALAHYFKQNGDLCADPDMEVRIFPETQQAEAMTFQQAIPPVFHQVYPEPGKVIPVLKRDLNNFLNQWLSNAISQGHSFKDVVEA